MWTSVLPFGICLGGWVMYPLTYHSCTLLGAEANFTSYFIGKFQTKSKSR